MHWSNSGLIGLFLLGLVGCQDAAKKQSDPTDSLLASVFNKKLYASDLEKIAPAYEQKDSVVVVNSSINRWIKQTLMMREAERNIPEDLNLKELVDNYRESLILHNYEAQLISTELDTVISQSILQKYYEEYKSQYVLKYTIVKGYLLKVSKNAKETYSVRQALDKDVPNIEEVGALMKEENVVSMMENDVWYKGLDIIDMIPNTSMRIGDMKEGRLIELPSGNTRIFFKILEKFSADENAPLTYIEDQIKRIILHERKIKLLEDFNEELYEKALRNNHVKIYSE